MKAKLGEARAWRRAGRWLLIGALSLPVYAQQTGAADPEKADSLVKAARFGQMSTVEILLNERIPVDSRSKLGDTALIAAANGGHLAVITALMAAGADLNAANHEGRTALMSAAIRGDTGIMEKLIAAQANVDAKDKRGETALFDAVRYGHLPAVKLLLANGANPNMQNTLPPSVAESGYTPLMYVARHPLSGSNEDWIAITKELLAKGADPNIKNARGDSAVTVGEAAGYHDIVSLLHDGGAKRSLTYAGLSLHDALVEAARNQDTVKVREILELGADPNGETRGGVVPLLAAALGGSRDVTRTLVEYGAKVNTIPNGLREWAFHDAKFSRNLEELALAASRGDTALILAARLGHTEVADYLLAQKADPLRENRRGDTPLSVAAEQGHAAVLKLLLDAGVHPNEGRSEETPVAFFEVAASDLERSAPLVKAAQGGYAEAVELLLKAGARADTRGFAGKTALFWATERGHESVVKSLLEHRANPDIKDDAGLTPLMAAARSGNVGIVRQLIAHGAELDAREGVDITPGLVRGPGTTALMLAANGGHKAVVDALLAAGADIGMRDNAGQTAVDAAFKNGYTDIVASLRGG